MMNVKRIGSLAVATVVASLGSMANAASVYHTLTVAQLEAFAPDASLSTLGVTQNGTLADPLISFAGGVNLNGDFTDPISHGPASMAGWTVSGLNIATVAGDGFALHLENQNGSIWSYELFVNGNLVDSLIDVPNTLPASFGTVKFADTLGATINTVSIKMFSTIGVPVGNDPIGDVRVTAVPVPAAAWLGMTTLGGLGLIRRIGSKHRA